MSELWCVLDLHGTLVQVDWRKVNEAIDWTAGVHRDRVRQGIELARTRRLLGEFATVRAEWDWICAQGGIEVSALPEALARTEVGTISETWQVSSVLTSFATDLRRRGVKLAIASNCYRASVAILRTSSLASLTDHIFASCEMHRAKPDIGFFDQLIQNLDVGQGECLLIDDTAANCSVVQTLGWHAIEYRWELSLSDLRGLFSDTTLPQ